MTDLFELLKSLLSAPGPSGYEETAARLIADHWRPLADEIHLSRLGSVHALKRGRAPAPRFSLLLAAHMDTIGLMVSGIQEGFLLLTPIGGVDARILPGQAVIVHATGNGRGEALPGVIALLPRAETGAPDFAHLRLDLGLPAAQVAESVQVGDLVTFETEAVRMSDEIVCAAGLDNRASLAVVTLCLQGLHSRSHAWDVWAAATVQEEVTANGAATSAYQVRPSLAIAVDTTYGKGPGADDWNTFPLGKGPTLGYGPNIHPYLYRRFKQLVEQLEIPYTTEFMPSSSGTDGMAIQVTAEGIPTFVLSIPIRNMHTPVEMACLTDLQRAARLLTEFIASLEVDFLERMTWDDDLQTRSL